MGPKNFLWVVWSSSRATIFSGRESFDRRFIDCYGLFDENIFVIAPSSEEAIRQANSYWLNVENGRCDRLKFPEVLTTGVHNGR